MEKQISKKEYLEALEIVEAYHNQIFHEASLIKQSAIIKTSLSEFLQKEKDISGLVESALNEYLKIFGNLPLESVSKRDFLKLRNAGKKSWNKFEELREKYITNKFRNDINF